MAGCAAVASAQGDVPQLLDEGRCGVLIERPDPATWVEILNDLLDDHDRIAQLGRAAREWVLDQLTWRRTAERVAAVLETVVLDAAPGPDKRAGGQRSQL